MKKLILAIAAVTAFGATAAYAAGDTAEIEITQSRCFEGEEITEANSHLITAAGADKITGPGAFTAYVASEGSGYRIVRAEKAD